MKKTSLLWGALCAALLLSGCKEEQTVLSLENLPTTTIEGTLVYDAGYKESNGAYVRDSEAPAANVPVRVTVGYDQYQSGAAGTKVYEGQTDGNGKYSVQIHTTLTGVMAEVNPMPFEAPYGELVEADGTQSLKTVQYYYTMSNPVTFGSTETMPGIVNKKQDKAAFSGEEVEGEKAYPYNIVVKGLVKVQMEDESGIENYVGQANRQVKVYFTRTQSDPYYGITSDPVVVVTGTTGGMQGEYQVNLPIDNLSGTYYITVEAMPFQDKYYDYSYNGVAEELQGIYAATSGVTTSFSPEGFNNRVVTMSDLKMHFTANE